MRETCSHCLFACGGNVSISSQRWLGQHRHVQGRVVRTCCTPHSTTGSHHLRCVHGLTPYLHVKMPLTKDGSLGAGHMVTATVLPEAAAELCLTPGHLLITGGCPDQPPQSATCPPAPGAGSLHTPLHSTSQAPPSSPEVRTLHSRVGAPADSGQGEPHLHPGQEHW